MDGKLHVIYGTVAVDGGIGKSWIFVDQPAFYVLDLADRRRTQQETIEAATEAALAGKHTAIVVHKPNGLVDREIKVQ